MYNLNTNKLESERCLLCKNARCTKACPISTDISRVIGLYKEDKKEEAKKILFENNPFSSVCSIVCDWYRQCAGSCIRGIKGEPIHFYEIEQELSIEYLLNDVSFKLPEYNGKKVAVIGGGPSGITVALILAQKGYKITMFEAEEKIGGVLRYGIPQFRLDRKIIDKYEDLLLQLGVEIKNNIYVGKDILLDEIVKSYDATFIGSGAGKAKKMGINGENNEFVYSAIDFLKNPSNYKLGNKTIIIGGGNVAMDAARVANRLNVDTTVYYRKTFENMPANKIEIDDAKKEGVKFEIFKVPVEITLNGIIFCDSQNVVEDGKIVTKIVENSEQLVECDSIIVAVSQTTLKDISTDSNLNFNKWDLIETDDSDMTNIEGVFSCGDVVSGAQTVVLAVNNAKRTALNIDKYIKEKIYE